MEYFIFCAVSVVDFWRQHQSTKLQEISEQHLLKRLERYELLFQYLFLLAHIK